MECSSTQTGLRRCPEYFGLVIGWTLILKVFPSLLGWFMAFCEDCLVWSLVFKPATASFKRSRVVLILRFFYGLQTWNKPLKSCSFWSPVAGQRTSILWCATRGTWTSGAAPLQLRPVWVSAPQRFSADTGLAERVAGAQIILTRKEGK